MYNPKEILNGRRVLIVDDDTLILSGVSRYLRRQGADILQTDDISQAFEMYQRNKSHSPVEAVLSDYDMPKGNGDELFNKIKTDFPDDYDLLVKIGWSGRDISRFYGRYDLGDIIPLPKPLDPPFLRDVLAQNLAYKDRIRNLVKNQI